MAIKEEKIWVKLSPANVKHYEKLSYIETREKNKQGKYNIPKERWIEVNISDLTKGAHVKLTRICDMCHKEDVKILYKNILRGRNKDILGLDLCKICSGLNRWNNFRNNLKFEESLAYLFPEIAKEWDEEKNGNLKPLNVTAKSGIKVWWKCKVSLCGHEWETSVNDRFKGFSCYKCYARNNTGENNPNWNPLLTQEEREKNRNYSEYQDWRISVYRRDNFTCQCCGNNKSGSLNAHHKDGFNWCEERRVDVSNGVTLCEDCHLDFHFMYGYGYNTEEQFNEWLLEFLTEYENKTNELIKLNIDIAM